jgi:hypothetical protein
MKRLAPSPAMLVALLALFLAGGGVGYAATTIGSNQIANNAVRSADIRDGTIGLKDLNAKVRAALRGASGARGATGARGLEGPAGATGPTGPAGATSVVVRTDSVSVPDGTVGEASVQCNFGEKAVGGGGGIAATGGRSVVQSGPVDASEVLPTTAGAVPTGWRADSLNSTGLTQNAFVYAVCVSP